MVSFCRKYAFQRTLTVMFACLVTTLGWSQTSTPSDQAAPPAPQSQRFVGPDYAKPRSHFPNPIAPYEAQHLPAPDLRNAPRMETLMRDGKLYLSMDDAIALTLENNLDIAIARYNLSIADTDVLRTKAGAPILGVNTGLVQGTPGGGSGGLSGVVGSGAGGTTVAAGGAGAGTLGIVSSTLGAGPTITSFDPIITSTLQWDRGNSLATSPFSGAPVLNQNTNTYNFLYNQGFQWGTNMSVGWNNSRITSNGTFSTFSPQLSSGFQFRLTQHLLQGLGFAPNTRFIRIAKNNREISDVAFRLQVITTVDQIENIYWDLVFAYENVRVQKEALQFASKTLSDNKKQVEIGSLAPIEIVRAQSSVAADQQALTVALTNLQLQQLLMKNALSRTLVDPRLAGAEVIPTSTMNLPSSEEVVPTEDLINEALSHRAELAESRIDLTNRELSNKSVRNNLLPTLDLFAYYGGSGLGGTQNPANVCTDPTTQQFCATANPNPNLSQFPLAPTVSYSSTLNQLVNSTSPDKGIGFSINVPLRNRAAQATQIRSELEYRQAQMRLQQVENQVRIEVRNAQFSVQQNLASVESAQAAVDLGHQSLDAEQKKYVLGASTTTLVLQNESALAQAESTLVSARAAYEKSRVELDRATGLLLDHTGILVSDAVQGEVTHMPTAPHVAPRPPDPPPAAPQTMQPDAPAPAPPQQ